MQTPEMLAAVDLGSNSFHLVISRVMQGELQIVDRLQATIRLAGGLGSDQRLNDETAMRALKCLEMFGQRLRDVPSGGVRAVGTSTLRRAKNASEFLFNARVALGHPIEIISGREEARLIYLGVAHSIADDDGRRFVVDIGGGSTECILGERFEALLTDSLDMGCVGYTTRFFADGDCKENAMNAALTAARQEIQPYQRRYRSMGWDQAIGASGTIGAVAEVLQENGWSKKSISAAGLEKLRKAIIAAGKTSKLALPGLKPERAPVLPAGVAVLSALFEAFDIKKMTPASGALREGVLYDLLGRIRHEDVRDRTILSFAERYHVDLEQAGRVERTAVHLLKQVALGWQLDETVSRQWLAWAARLHEVGLAVAHSGYHKHGAYLVGNADLAGFSKDDQNLLADLIRTHRKKLVSLVKDLAPQKNELTLHLALLLRLAVVLNRSRSSRPLPPVGIAVEKQVMTLTFPPRWLDDHSLTLADLQTEREALAEIGWGLVVGAGK